MRLTSKLACALLPVATTVSMVGAAPTIAIARPPAIVSSGHEVSGRLLVSGLSGTIGGTIGPDGALYVPEATVGRITRVDVGTARTSTFAEGLPPQVIPLGGVIDVAFVGTTAYALVTLVSPDVGGAGVDGIYRIDSRRHFTVIADIGAWSIAHPPATDFDVPTGLQYALAPVPGGFLVSDGHHNRVLRVTLHGQISQLRAFGNVVPTGLAVSGNKVYLTEAGPVPYRPEDSRLTTFGLHGAAPREIASGYSLLVDVAVGPHSRLYALSQGDSPGPDVQPADPAKPDTGRLLRVNRNGTLNVLVDKLDRPASLHFSCGDALIVTVTGQVWQFKNLGEWHD